jgi:hypothetical protein
MSASLSEPRKKFIAIAQDALQRSLTADEIEAVRDFPDAVVEIAVESLTSKEIVDILNDVCRKDGPVVLLKQLASTTDSLTAGRQRLLRFLKPNARKMVASFDLDSELKRFAKWFLALLRTEPPAASIQALRFGLFEIHGGCKLYVAGSAVHKDKGSCANDWLPIGRYSPLHALSKVYQKLSAQECDRWVVAQAIAILLIKAFFQKHAAEIKGLFGKKKLFITSGFEDGDLYAIKIREVGKRGGQGRN